MLARHGRRLLNLLDDTPVVPGDARPPFEHAHQARQILNDAEDDLREWTPNLEPVHSAAGDLGANLMPIPTGTTATTSVVGQDDAVNEAQVERRITGSDAGPADSLERREGSGSSVLAGPNLEPSAGYRQ